MARTKPGAVRIGVDYITEYIAHPVTGNVATDGIVYSTIATFGTTSVEIFNALIDPGLPLALQRLEVGLTQMFTGLNGSFVGSVMYYWQAKTEADRIGSGGVLSKLEGAWVNLTGTYQKAVGTLTTSEDTFSGYVPLGSIPYAPVRISLNAVGVKAAVCQGKVKNSTYIRLIGNAIPGT